MNAIKHFLFVLIFMLDASVSGVNYLCLGGLVDQFVAIGVHGCRGIDCSGVRAK